MVNQTLISSPCSSLVRVHCAADSGTRTTPFNAEIISTTPSRRRDCHVTGTPCLPKFIGTPATGAGVYHQMTVSPTANNAVVRKVGVEHGKRACEKTCAAIAVVRPAGRKPAARVSGPAAFEGRGRRARAVGLSCLTLVIGRFSRDYRGLRFKNTIIPLPYVGPGSIRGASTGADQDGKGADSVAKPAAGQCEEERPRSRD